MQLTKKMGLRQILQFGTPRGESDSRFHRTVAPRRRLAETGDSYWLLLRSPVVDPFASEFFPVIALDEQLEGRVQRALQCHPNLANGHLKSETNDGRVTLRGVVSTYYQKQIAQELMRSIDGVREVVNHLEVNWKQPRRTAASA